MLLIYSVILIGIIGSGIFLIIKGDSKKSLFIICLGVNLIIIPLSLFIGGMATDAPDSDMFDFFKGFLFIQAIPLVLLLISILKILLNSRKSKEK
jgi:hypothetical protein